MLINKIFQICKIKNVKLIFVVTPIYKKNKSDNLIISNIVEISKLNGIDIFDFTNEKLFEKTTEMFKDNLHLNFYGSYVFSVKLGEKLIINI